MNPSTDAVTLVIQHEVRPQARPDYESWIKTIAARQALQAVSDHPFGDLPAHGAGVVVHVVRTKSPLILIHADFGVVSTFLF